jgi:hypothetical protein
VVDGENGNNDDQDDADDGVDVTIRYYKVHE